MEDLKRVWDVSVRLLHIAVSFINEFASTAPVTLGYVLVFMAALVKLYQRRRAFYSGLDIAADWEPRYGSIIYAYCVEYFLKMAFLLTLVLGLTVLSFSYLPVFSADILGFVVTVTG